MRAQWRKADSSALGRARAQPKCRNDSVGVSGSWRGTNERGLASVEVAILSKALTREVIREKRMRGHMRHLQTQKGRLVRDALGGLRFVRSAGNVFAQFRASELSF